jgi:hypothetical protein
MELFRFLDIVYGKTAHAGVHRALCDDDFPFVRMYVIDFYVRHVCIISRLIG